MNRNMIMLNSHSLFVSGCCESPVLGYTLGNKSPFNYNSDSASLFSTTKVLVFVFMHVLSFEKPATCFLNKKKHLQPRCEIAGAKINKQKRIYIVKILTENDCRMYSDIIGCLLSDDFIDFQRNIELFPSFRYIQQTFSLLL
jgi:hypothetical protein